MSVLNQIGHVENPSARILFTQVAQTAPGQCGICGKGQSEEGFADTQLDFEFWGRLIFCKDCVAEIASVFGFISSVDYEDLLGEKDLAQLQFHGANDKIIELEKVIDGFTNLRSYLSTVSTGTIDPDIFPLQEIIVTSDESESGPIQNTSETISENSGQSGTTPESPRKQRLLNI